MPAPSPYTDRWERTKRHLLRNFLVNPGFQLSPIPEDERSSPDSDSGSLPDLIVEPVPDRHDHPPCFYEGLERRMQRLYRQLFLGQNESCNEHSSDFEVNQSMTSTRLNIDTRKDYETENILLEKNIDSDQDISKAEEKQLTKSTIEDDGDDASVNDVTYNGKLIDTCATYSETSRISTDDSNRSSSVENEGEENVQSLESRSKSNAAETNLSANEGNDTQDDDDDVQTLTNKDKFNDVDKGFQTIEEESGIIETKSVSEDSITQCLRISTTVAQIHEPPRDITQSNNGSPVLIPRLIRFGREVFGTRIMRRFSGQSKILETSDENINQLPTHTSEDLNKRDATFREPETDVQRLLAKSELTRIDKTVDIEVLDVVTTEKKQANVNKNHEINTEDKIPVIGIESDKEDHSNVEADHQNKTTETGVQNTSIDWNIDGIDDDEDWFPNAVRKREFTSKARKFNLQSSYEESFDENLEPIAHSSISEDVERVEVMREGRESGVNVSWHGVMEQASPALAFETKTSADKPEVVPTDSSEIDASLEVENEMSAEEEQSATNSRDNAIIIDDFWSVSSIEFDVDNLPNKRRSDCQISEDPPASKRKKNIAIQTNSDEKSKWEDVRKELFVGSPLVFRLCGCKDHICS